TAKSSSRAKRKSSLGRSAQATVGNTRAANLLALAPSSADRSGRGALCSAAGSAEASRPTAATTVLGRNDLRRSGRLRYFSGTSRRKSPAPENRGDPQRLDPA